MLLHIQWDEERNLWSFRSNVTRAHKYNRNQFLYHLLMSKIFMCVYVWCERQRRSTTRSGRSIDWMPTMWFDQYSYAYKWLNAQARLQAQVFLSTNNGHSGMSNEIYSTILPIIITYGLSIQQNFFTWIGLIILYYTWALSAYVECRQSFDTLIWHAENVFHRHFSERQRKSLKMKHSIEEDVRAVLFNTNFDFLYTCLRDETFCRRTSATE